MEFIPLASHRSCIDGPFELHSLLQRSEPPLNEDGPGLRRRDIAPGMVALFRTREHWCSVGDHGSLARGRNEAEHPKLVKDLLSRPFADSLWHLPTT